MSLQFRHYSYYRFIHVTGSNDESAGLHFTYSTQSAFLMLPYENIEVTWKMTLSQERLEIFMGIESISIWIVEEADKI